MTSPAIKRIKILLICAALLFAVLAAGCAPSLPGNASQTEPPQTTADPVSEALPSEDESEPDEQTSGASENESDVSAESSGEDVSGADIESSSPSVEEGSVLYRSLSLPESSSVWTKTLASQMLGFCSGVTADVTSYVFEKSGFEVVLQSGFDKDPQDSSHTCAFTVGKGTILYGGGLRTVFLIAVRGTSGAEWISNFDFAPSHSNDTAYAENFLACAEDVVNKSSALFDEEEDPVIAVCGHSRGAACANLVGVLLNRTYPKENVFIYTYATPTTVRPGSGFDNSGQTNIFNFINPCDVVTKLPLEAWGFSRAGTDIVLKADEKEVAKVDAAVSALTSVAPTIADYYKTKHPLSPKSGSEKKTTFEVMTMLTGSLGSIIGISAAALQNIGGDSDFYPVVLLFNGPGGNGSLTVLMQHMPALYLVKISDLEEPD